MGEREENSQKLFHLLERRVGLFKESVDDPLAEFLPGIVVHLEDLLKGALVDFVAVLEHLAGARIALRL